MVSVADVQNQILLEVGDTPDNLIAANIANIWNNYAYKAATFQDLQYLYVKRSCIELVRATLRNQVDYSIDGALSLHLSQRTDYLQDQYKQTCAEIVRVEKMAQASRPSVIGQLTAGTSTVPTTPIPQPPPNDAASPLYQGTPYFAPADNTFSEPGSPG